jgi:hypothetical protein
MSKTAFKSTRIKPDYKDLLRLLADTHVPKLSERQMLEFLIDAELAREQRRRAKK